MKTDDLQAERPGMPYRIQVEAFEGPLDLLLYLIKKNELDVCEVSLSQIADQYLRYIDTMECYNLETAGDFILVAATLMLLKSQALLPGEKVVLDDEDLEVETPAELVRRLLEYKKYKEASGDLKMRNTLFDSVFARGLGEDVIAEFRVTHPKVEVHVDELVRALLAVLKKTARVEPVHEIAHEPISIGQRILQIFTTLKEKKDLQFEDLLAAGRGRDHVIVSFLAILEMARLSLIRIYQSETFQTLRIQGQMDDAGAAEEKMQILLGDEERLGYRGRERANGE